MQVDHRTDRSVPMFLLHTLIRPLKPRLATSSKTYPAGSQRLTAPSTVTKANEIVEREVADIYVYDIIPRERAATPPPAPPPPSPPPPSSTTATGPAKRLYYFCGGGWQGPPTKDHWIFLGELARRLPDVRISVVSHPLAPACPAAVCFPALRQLYAALADEAVRDRKSLILGGDSSGGNLVLCVALDALKDDPERRRPHASALLAISPAVNLVPVKDEGVYRAANRLDPVLSLASHNREVTQWAGEEDPAASWISPWNADLKLLKGRGVKLIGVTGGHDILTPDALEFRRRCVEAGVDGEWLDWDKQMHCFPLAVRYRLPESRRGVDWIAQRLRDL